MPAKKPKVTFEFISGKKITFSLREFNQFESDIEGRVQRGEAIKMPNPQTGEVLIVNLKCVERIRIEQ